MKAVVLGISEQELARRRQLGLDRWDEMWEGVLHLVPSTSYEHQRILDELIEFLGPHVKRRRGILRSNINVFNETAVKADYRIPGLTFIAAGRERSIAPDGIRGGGPDAVFEIRSPDDETYDKLPFYAGLGVREVIVIDRDTKEPQIYRLAGSAFRLVPQDEHGWVTADTLRVRFRHAPGTPAHLVVEDALDPSARLEI